MANRLNSDNLGQLHQPADSRAYRDQSNEASRSRCHSQSSTSKFASYDRNEKHVLEEARRRHQNLGSQRQTSQEFIRLIQRDSNTRAARLIAEQEMRLIEKHKLKRVPSIDAKS